MIPKVIIHVNRETKLVSNTYFIYCKIPLENCFWRFQSPFQTNTNTKNISNVQRNMLKESEEILAIAKNLIAAQNFWRRRQVIKLPFSDEYAPIIFFFSTNNTWVKNSWNITGTGTPVLKKVSRLWTGSMFSVGNPCWEATRHR